jgi:glycosyltransferase involved in cell wall biosynthesis
MNVSVALTTYNGARFLQEQLQSIADQSRLPDQVVIVDDRSSDQTQEIIHAFATSAPFLVNLYVNETTLGPTRNFQRAVELCNGEIIVLCDQDDRWHPERLFQINEAFSACPNVGLVFSDAELIDEHGKSLNRRLWQQTFNENYQCAIRSGRAFELLVQHDVVTGATMAFRRYYRNAVLPFATGIPLFHDGWIAVIIAAIGEVSTLRQPLIDYRIHQHQYQGIEPFNKKLRTEDFQDNSSLRKRSSYYAGHIDKLRAVLQRLDALCKLADARMPLETLRSRIAYVESLINHFDARAGLPEGKFGRASIVLKELLTLRYHRYSRGWLSAVRDLTI